MKRSTGDDNSVASSPMTNGFGSPPNIDQQPSQLQQQQQQQQQQQPPQHQQHREHRPDAFDYFDSSATKARSNLFNVNGATSIRAQMNEESIDIASVSQRSQCRVVDDIYISKSASAPHSVAKYVQKAETCESITKNSVDQIRSDHRHNHPAADREEAETNHDANSREEPDEIACLMPFICVDSIEDLVDPLMDTDEPSDSTQPGCHNGDVASETNVVDEYATEDAAADQFVSPESAVADASSSVVVESRVPLDERRRLPLFRCGECRHSFATESEVQFHRETSDVALLCEQCESSLWSPCALNRHKSEHAAAMKRVACASGYRADGAISLQQSRGLFADKPHACQHCGAAYTTKFNLMRHVRKNVVWPRNGEPFKCDLCDATFLAKCLLPAHKREQHAEFMQLDSQVAEDSMNYVETALEPEAESVIVTPQFDLLERECDPLEEESRAAAASSYHTFKTATAMGISYNCKWCPEKVPSHPALVKHIRETHPDVELFRCEPCDKTFLNKAGLYGHLTHHRFQCDKCDSNFSTEEFLRQHRVVHGDDAASYSTASALTCKPSAKSTAPRSRSVKSKRDGMPYFQLLARLPLMEKPYECEFCDKKFAYKTTFLEHYLTHTGEKPFQCSVCGLGFIRERAMEIHEYSHRGLLPPPPPLPHPTVTQPLSQPQRASSTSTTTCTSLPAPAPFALVAKDFTVINGRRQTARKSTNAAARPSNRITPIARAIVNSALFDPELDVTPEDMEAFYYLPVVRVKMADVSALEDHAYVCPYCDKFFPRPTSLCGHKKICSYLTRMRAQKASAAAMGLPMPVVARKWAPRISGVSSVARSSANCNPSSRMNLYVRPEDSVVVIANMRHHIVFERGERVFVCGVCGKQFSRKFTLSEHCRSHTTDRPFLCDRCPRAFKRKSSLFRHRRRNHAKMGALSDCQPSLAQHPMADQNWMSFEPQCNVKIEFSDGDDDEEEDDEDDDTPGDEDDFKPSVEFGGGEYSAQQVSFSYDYPEMSVFEPQCIVKDQVSSDEEDGGSRRDYYAADDRGDELIDASMNHFLEVGLTNNGETSGGDDDDGASAADAENAWTEEPVHGRPEQPAVVDRFLCGECNRRFPRREDLRRHFAEHDSVGPYKCFYCDKTFDRRKYLSKHARSHDKKKTYQCSYCERAYVTNAELTIHVRIHTGERPFECDQCGKGFRVQKQLTLHYRTHTGEKPYACAHCPSTFSRHETLFRHNRVCQAKNNAAARPGPGPGPSPAQPLATPQLSQLLQRPSQQQQQQQQPSQRASPPYA